MPRNSHNQELDYGSSLWHRFLCVHGPLHQECRTRKVDHKRHQLCHHDVFARHNRRDIRQGWREQQDRITDAASGCGNCYRGGQMSKQVTVLPEKPETQTEGSGGGGGRGKIIARGALPPDQPPHLPPPWWVYGDGSTPRPKPKHVATENQGKPLLAILGAVILLASVAYVFLLLFGAIK